MVKEFLKNMKVYRYTIKHGDNTYTYFDPNYILACMRNDENRKTELKQYFDESKNNTSKDKYTSLYDGDGNLVEYYINKQFIDKEITIDETLKLIISTKKDIDISFIDKVSLLSAYSGITLIAILYILYQDPDYLDDILRVIYANKSLVRYLEDRLTNYAAKYADENADYFQKEIINIDGVEIKDNVDFNIVMNTESQLLSAENLAKLKNNIVEINPFVKYSKEHVSSLRAKMTSDILKEHAEFPFFFYVSEIENNQEYLLRYCAEEITRIPDIVFINLLLKIKTNKYFSNGFSDPEFINCTTINTSRCDQAITQSCRRPQHNFYRIYTTFIDNQSHKINRLSLCVYYDSNMGNIYKGWDDNNEYNYGVSLSNYGYTLTDICAILNTIKSYFNPQETESFDTLDLFKHELSNKSDLIIGNDYGINVEGNISLTNNYSYISDSVGTGPDNLKFEILSYNDYQTSYRYYGVEAKNNVKRFNDTLNCKYLVLSDSNGQGNAEYTKFKIKKPIISISFTSTNYEILEGVLKYAYENNRTFNTLGNHSIVITNKVILSNIRFVLDTNGINDLKLINAGIANSLDSLNINSKNVSIKYVEVSNNKVCIDIDNMEFGVPADKVIYNGRLCTLEEAINVNE